VTRCLEDVKDPEKDRLIDPPLIAPPPQQELREALDGLGDEIIHALRTKQDRPIESDRARVMKGSGRTGQG
jgi:hypothetical protein